jgi:hypothetical protein
MIRALLPGEISARRRPRALGMVWVCEALWAIVVAAPLSSFARHAFQNHPDGDALIFEPGARHLMAWLDLFGEHGATGNVVRITLLLLLLGAVLAQLPLAFLLAALATGEGEDGKQPRIGESLRASAGSILALGGVLVLVTLIEGFFLVIGGVAAGAASHAVAKHGTDAGAFWTLVGVFALFSIIAAWVGIAADLARAAIVRDVAITDDRPAGPLTLLALGIRRTARVGFRGHRRAIAEWAPRAAIGLALFALGAIASEVLGGRGGLALAALTVLHQVVIFGRVAVRASWLARALRIVGG